MYGVLQLETCSCLEDEETPKVSLRWEVIWSFRG